MSENKKTTDWPDKEVGIAHFCNFRPIVKSVVTVLNADGKEIATKVRMKLDFDNDGYIFPAINSGQRGFQVFPSFGWEISRNLSTFDVQSIFDFQSGNDEFTVSLLGLSEEKWIKHNKKCRINPAYPEKTAGRHIADEILRQVELENTKQEVQYRLKDLGFYNINETKLYRAGDQIIWSYEEENKLNIELESFPKSLKFIIDTDRYAEKDATSGMVKLICLSPNNGRVVFAQSLAGIMMSLFVEIGVIPDTAIQWIQKTGVFKTTYSSFMTQLYNRDGKIKPSSRLNSTTAAITQILHENRDCCIIIDDIHPAESHAIKQKNETTLEEITRRLGDNMGKNRMYGNKQMELSPNCTVIVPGEYEHGKGSTAARTLVTDYEESIDSMEFHKLQQEPLIVSTWYYYFIKWIVSNYNELKTLLSQWLTHYRDAKLCEHKRLQETHFYLNASYTIFLNYCFNKDFLEEHEAQKLQKSFSELLMDLVERQQVRINRHNKFTDSSDPDYLGVIRSLFNNKNISYPTMPMFYDEKTHDGIVKDDCLCLRRVRLEEKIKRVVPQANMTDVINDLKLKNALIVGNEGKYVIQKRVNGKKLRFYAIPLSKLN